MRADAEEQATWRTGADDLTLDVVVDRLLADLRERGVLEGETPQDPELSQLFIDSYIRFPRSGS